LRPRGRGRDDDLLGADQADHGREVVRGADRRHAVQRRSPFRGVVVHEGDEAVSHAEAKDLAREEVARLTGAYDDDAASIAVLPRTHEAHVLEDLPVGDPDRGHADDEERPVHGEHGPRDARLEREHVPQSDQEEAPGGSGQEQADDVSGADEAPLSGGEPEAEGQTELYGHGRDEGDPERRRVRARDAGFEPDEEGGEQRTGGYRAVHEEGRGSTARSEQRQSAVAPSGQRRRHSAFLISGIDERVRIAPTYPS